MPPKSATPKTKPAQRAKAKKEAERKEREEAKRKAEEERKKKRAEYEAQKKEEQRLAAEEKKRKQEEEKKRKEGMYFQLRNAAKPTALRLARDGDVREKSDAGESLMFAAAGRPASKNAPLAVEICKMLRARGLSTTAKSDRNETALYEAVRAENVDAARWFLNNGCDVDLVNERGETPICIAFYQSHMDMVLLLLSCGASLDYEDPEGRKPVQFADPLFRKAFYAARAEGGDALLAQPVRATNSRKRPSARQPDPPYKRFKGTGAANCKGEYYLRHWVYPDEPHGQGGRINPEQGRTYSSNSEFEVQEPPVSAASKLRAMQRELCEDHAYLFPELMLALSPGEWAKFMGVSEEEFAGQSRMVEIIKDSAKEDACEFLLAGVHKESRNIVGYVHMQYYKATEHVEVAYIKVMDSQRGLGVGKLLLESGVQACLERGWKFGEVLLTVNMRNADAISWYKRMGFRKIGCDVRKPKSMYKEWLVMRKRMPKEPRQGSTRRVGGPQAGAEA